MLLTASCLSVPALTSDGSKVRVTVNNQETVGCMFVGNVEAMDRVRVGDSATSLQITLRLLAGTSYFSHAKRE
jgi:hypothetical protein